MTVKWEGWDLTPGLFHTHTPPSPIRPLVGLPGAFRRLAARSVAGLPLQVTCHELCHLLGLGRCRWLRCIMQGALSLDEALRRPLDLCPICLRKLQHVLGFKLVDRYKVSGWWGLLAWVGTTAIQHHIPGCENPRGADRPAGLPVAHAAQHVWPVLCTHNSGRCYQVTLGHRRDKGQMTLLRQGRKL